MIITKLGTFLAAACVMMIASLASARQCEDQWLPEGGLAGFDDVARASIEWDPDGAGPQPKVLVVGGSFRLAGSQVCGGLAIWDGQTWAAFGAGATGGDYGAVYSFVVLPNGHLVAGGHFDFMDGVPCNNIAEFDGIEWRPLGAGVKFTFSPQTAGVAAMIVMPNGDLIVGGRFTVAGGQTALSVAAWNGGSWSPMGDGFNTWQTPSCACFHLLPDGSLLAGGGMTKSGSTTLGCIAIWNGTSWAPFGVGFNGGVGALVAMPDASIVAAGGFSTADGLPANYFARWNGTTWQEFAPGLSGGTFGVIDVAIMPDGRLIAGGDFTKIGSTSVNCLTQWDGTVWTQVATGVFGYVLGGTPRVTCLSVRVSGELIVAGNFTRVSGSGASRIAVWDGVTIRSVGSELNDFVDVLTTSPSGELYIAGAFETIDGHAVNYVARRSGESWLPLGEGLYSNPPIWNHMNAILVLADSSVVVAGNFKNAGSNGVSYIARWDGSQWLPLGLGLNSAPYALMQLPDGRLLAAGGFTKAEGVTVNGVAVWDGTHWEGVGGGFSGGTLIRAAAVLPNGNLVVGGSFSLAAGAPGDSIVQWNGFQWLPMGAGLTGGTTPTVYALQAMPNGSVIAGGRFSTTTGGLGVSNIAKWDGSAWSRMGSGCDASVLDLDLLPNGDLIAVGSFSTANGISAKYAALWSGNAWRSFDALSPDRPIDGVAVAPNGDLAFCGGFTTINGVPSPYFARHGSPCVCPADFNHDGFVNGNDYDEFADLFDIADPGADFNGDGFVNGNDYDEFADHFDVGC